MISFALIIKEAGSSVLVKRDLSDRGLKAIQTIASLRNYFSTPCFTAILELLQRFAPDAGLRVYRRMGSMCQASIPHKANPRAFSAPCVGNMTGMSIHVAPLYWPAA